MAAGKGRPKRFAELEERLAKDYDPEADAPLNDSDDNQSEGSSDEFDGTEHYVSVGKSKLRQADPVSLGPQYRGKRVSRSALGDSDGQSEGSGDEDEESDESVSEEYDDPEIADLEADHVDEDEEIDSDEAFCESDQEKFSKFTFRGSSRPQEPAGGRRKKRPVAADFLSDSEEDSEDESSHGGKLNGVSKLPESGDEDEEEEGEDEDDVYEDEDGNDSEALGSDDEDASSVSGSDTDNGSDGSSGKEDDNNDRANERAELRKIMSEGQKKLAATMSEAARADANKGRAVRQQRRSFDSLLNIRIRLQKALVAANSLAAIPEGEQATRESEGEPYEAAEEAAFKLWSSIETFRHSLLPTSSAAAVTAAGQKRKRDKSSAPETSLEEMWEDMKTIESRAMTHRRKVLEKWSNKVRSTTAVASTRKLGAGIAQSLTSILDDQLVNSDKLVKRTRVPRSCAPVQAAKKVEEDPEIYDDADFYQLLLKELVDQRSLDSTYGGGAESSSVPTVRWAASHAAIREAKTRKQVDRRASKGRKLRFTVHEKLQNFMAPEDRRGWEQEAIDRFFGGLFGQQMELGEDEDGDNDQDDEVDGGASLEEQGLRLFRS